MELTENSISQEMPWTLNRVKICGTKSKNRRTYPLQTLINALPLYESAPVFIEHETKRKRRYEEMVGTISNARIEEEELYGDILLNPSKALAESIMWDFKHNTKRVGLSHTIEGKCENGIVSEISVVHSADIVFDPATTTSMKEEAECDYEARLNEHHDRLNSHDGRLGMLESKHEEAINELKNQNAQLITEINELKNKKSIISKNVMPSINKNEDMDLKQFVKTLKGKK